VPNIRKAIALCDNGVVNVNGKPVSSKYIFKPFDVVNLHTPKYLFKIKQRRQNVKRGYVALKRVRGLLF